jgi:hypothetical protein
MKGAAFNFWLGEFNNIKEFITSFLQKFSRKASGSLMYKLKLDFIPIQKEIHKFTENPKDEA